jgi:probable phosphoglycerate mutase
MAARRFTLLRHAQSAYNVEHILNGDPAVPVGLTSAGREQAAAVRRLLAGMDFDLAICTRFPRTAETLEIILGGRKVPIEVYPELDDVDVGDFEGQPLGTYRAWRAEHGPDQGPPGGESRIDALRRYAAGYERMLASGACEVLAVLHDVPIRFLVNAAHGSDPLGGPHQAIANATPISFGEDDLRRAVDRMHRRAAAAGAGQSSREATGASPERNPLSSNGEAETSPLGDAPSPPPASVA